MKRWIWCFVLLAATSFSRADLVVTPWVPLFKGVDHAVGTNVPNTTVTNNGVVFTNYLLQVVHCLRVDLTDPGVQLFPTPRATTGYDPDLREALTINITNFVRKYGVQVATDRNFFTLNANGSDFSVEGLPCNVQGMLISRGEVVSPADTLRTASLLFTTNKLPTLRFDNVPPARISTGFILR